MAAQKNVQRLTRLVAIECDDGEARILMATRSRRRVRLVGAARIEQAPGETLAATLEAQLKALLETHRMTGCDCVLSVGRGAVEMKYLSAPAVSDDELPDLVAMQALREFSAGEDWPIDYLPLAAGKLVDGAATEPLQRQVLAAALNPAVIAPVRAVCEAAGLNVVAVGLRPCGMTSMAGRQVDLNREEASLLIDPVGKQMNLSVERGGSLVFVRNARAECSVDEGPARNAILEVRRTLAAAASRLSGARLTHIYLCGGDNLNAFAELLEKEVGLPVQVIEPLGGLDLGADIAQSIRLDASRYAPLAGMLLDAFEGRRQSIDFLNPRKAVVTPLDKRRLAVWTLVAAGVVLLPVGYIWRQLHVRDAEIEQLAQEKVKATRLADKAKLIDQQTAELDAWVTSDINWLNGIYRLCEAMPPAPETMLTQLRAGVRADGGELAIEGLAKNAATIDEIERLLRKSKYDVEHKASLQSKDPHYHWVYKSSLLVPGVPPKGAAPPATKAPRAVAGQPARVTPAKARPAATTGPTLIKKG